MEYTYQIITDSSCDLPSELAKELELRYVPLSVRLEGKEYANYLDGRELDPKQFYATLRKKVPTSTSAATPGKWMDAIRPVLEKGQDVLVLAFSSGLSGTCDAATLAAKELAAAYPERTIEVIDTLAASMGQGLLCYYAATMRKEGKSLREVAAWVLENRLHLCHWFTVDDLMFLKRGGRVSAATAVVGSMLQIKPVLHVDDEGHLIHVSKARGRKASIEAMAAKVGETALIAPERQIMFISHGDCPEDAAYLEKILKARYHVPKVVTSYVGPVIGSHSGPGTLALFFLGTKR